MTVQPAAPLHGHPTTSLLKFHVEDWNDRVFGQSWMVMNGHPASLAYARRSVLGSLPLDDDVVYGKDPFGMGHLVHSSEISGEEAW